ncbi:substrate-binding protein [Listeria monocytogenes]|nr:substrate-binding protein [Listeria monocytogenes]EHT9032833.1 hypothetical protein [Listeria monocytogenes]MCN75684.1 substrate-binding protein [Listeria monocytogenes]MCN75844.1 substrate-binding protein [Listeria monocytogenes]
MMKYFKSFYTKLAFIMGVVMYLSYAIPTNNFANLYLIFISGFVAMFLPFFTKISEKVEQKTVFKTGSIFLGKIIRFLWQFVFNLFAVYTVLKGGVIQLSNLDMVGGIWGAVALSSFASQGLQYVMLALANRDIGNRYLNITLALSANVCLSAIASLGYQSVQIFFILFGLILGFVGAFYSLITDIRGLMPSQGGIGIFFGTFNPVHKTHMEIVKNFIESRKLEKVYIHPTVVPKLHQALLDEGVIRIAKMKDGMRIYEKTEKADFHIDYFPTGNTFYEVENRIAMLEAAVKDSNLEDKVEILYLPEIYKNSGFYGIISLLKKKHQGDKVYGLHGSDSGGMLVRNIYDESFVIPHVIVRKDNVSATAIRNGAKGMTTSTVDKMKEILSDDCVKNENEEYTFYDNIYVYDNHRLKKIIK